MPLTVTQALIDRGYELVMMKQQGKQITAETLTDLIFAVIGVTALLLKSKTKHEYKVQLITGILHKIVQVKVEDPVLSARLHEDIDVNVLDFIPEGNCFGCCSAQMINAN